MLLRMPRHHCRVKQQNCRAKCELPCKLPGSTVEIYAVHLKLECAQVLGRNDGVRDSQEGQQAWSDIQVQLPGGLKQIHVHVGLTYYDV